MRCHHKTKSSVNKVNPVRKLGRGFLSNGVNILICAMIVILFSKIHLIWISEPAYPNTPAAQTAKAGATIALLKEVTISNPVVTVGTIADIQSEDKAFFQHLSEIEIERAPVPGYLRILTVNDIKSRLRQHKIDLSQITFAGHERVLISTKSIEITPEQLLNFARVYLQEHFLVADPSTRRADKAGALTLNNNSIELAATPVKLIIPDGEVSFRIPGQSPLSKGGQGGLSQYTSIPIQIILNGKTYRTVVISLKIKSFKKVVVAAKAIPKDKHLDEADICMEERDVIHVLSSVLVDNSFVYGKRAKRHISQGEILTGELIETPPLIYREDKVTILLELPHLRITTLGMAKEDGHEGEIISVENLSSKKIITAKVINEKLVRVEL